MADGPPTPIDAQDFDNFVRQLREEGQHDVTHSRREKRDKEFEAQVKKFDDLVKGLWALVKSLYDPRHTLTAEQKQKALRDALVALFGALLGEKGGGKDLPQAIDNLVKIWQGSLDEKAKQKLLEDSIKALLVKAGEHGLGKEGSKGLDSLVEQIIILIKLATGSLTEEERNELLGEEAMKLLTSDLVVRQLEWFVSENFMTYTAAVKLGYQLGKPFGDRMAADLATFLKARYSTDVLLALGQKNPTWETDATLGTTTQVRIESGSYVGWQATAFWDHSANQVRIQVLTAGGHATLLDARGVDVTGEIPMSVPSAEVPVRESTVTRTFTVDVQRHVDPALKIAKGDAATEQVAVDTALRARDAAGAAWGSLAGQLLEVTDPELSRLPELRVELGHYAVGTPGHARIEAEIKAILDKRAALQSEVVKAWTTYQQAYDTWTKAVAALRHAILHGRRGLLTAAKFEHWGTGELEYLQWLVPDWAFSLDDIPSAGPTSSATAPTTPVPPAPALSPPKSASGSTPALRPRALAAAGAVAVVVGLGAGWTIGHAAPHAEALAVPASAVVTSAPRPSGGGPSSPPSPTTAAPPAATAQPPHLGPITATFVRPVTTYVVSASDPAGRPLTYTWSKTPERPCGVFGGSGPTATWSHPDAALGGDCPNEDAHPGTISVTVSNGLASVTAVYTLGSAPGTGAAPVTSTPPATAPSPPTATATGPAPVAVAEVTGGQAIDTPPTSPSSSDAPYALGAGAVLAAAGLMAMAVGGDVIARRGCDCSAQDAALAQAKARLSEAQAKLDAAKAHFADLQRQIADIDASIAQTQATLDQATQDLATAQQQLANVTQFVNGLGPVITAGSLSNHPQPGWSQVGGLWARDAHAAEMAAAAVAISKTLGGADPSTWQSWGQGELAAAQAAVAQLQAQVAASTAYLAELNGTRNGLVSQLGPVLVEEGSLTAAVASASAAVTAAQTAFDACVADCPSYLHG